MGKKSKRNRSVASSSNSNQSQQQSAVVAARQRRLDDNDDDEEDYTGEVNRRMIHPSLRKPEEETKDNLRFQDPFVEEYHNCDEDDDDDEGEEWEDVDDDDDEKEEGDEAVPMKENSTTRKREKGKSRDETEDSEMEEVVQTWNPFSKEHQKIRQQNNDVLEMDPTAYKMYHAMQNEWPSLSFDFIYDTYGVARTKFPHSILFVCGTQADIPNNNHLTIMKISDLHRIHIDTDDDILGEEIDKNDDDIMNDDNNDDIDDDDDGDVDDEEVEPVMEHYTIQHYGGVNRVRVMKQHYNSDIVASWSDTGTVNLYNIQSIRQRFLEPRTNNNTTTSNAATVPSQTPFFSYTNQDSGVEGFALDWSPIVAGRLATGDCHGSIHLWTPTSTDGGTSYDVSYLYNNVSNANTAATTQTPINSVEDLQWSPTEATVLAAASCDGSVRIFDVRKPGQAMIGHHIHDADVNVLSWNPLVTNLLATGGDDGTLAVWDLRHFSSSSSSFKSPSTIQPLARFTPHTTPITSVEWHPTDESMLVASDDIGTYIYDLSVEEDDTTGTNNHPSSNTTNIDPPGVVVPPQLLFVHNGSEQFKEVHWHPQITSCVMTTALTGLSVFIPSNL